MEKEIKIERYIIHFLEKEKSKTNSNLDLSLSISKSDEFSKTLVEELHKSITDSASLRNTKFKENNSNDFSNALDDYLASSDDNSFYSFSKSIEKLKNDIEKISFATGGYYLFVDYYISSKRYISVVLLRKKAGINIIKEGDIYKLNSAENLNIDKIAMAFRLNFEIYLKLETEEEKNNYLALITTQQDGEVSKYFRIWVNGGDLIKNATNTSNLIKILKTISRPVDENGIEIYKSLGEFQKAVYDYSKSNKNKLINVYDLSRHFYGDIEPNKIMDFAHECGIVIDPEFKKDTAKWRGLITIKASVDGIELNVDYNKVNDDEVKVLDDQIIIYSKVLANKIKAQHLEEKEKIERNG
jgi:nucleoid-associated protein